MGLFDTIQFHENCAPSCPAGHKLKSFQTKDLYCEMATYLVYHSKLYRELESKNNDDFGYDKVEVGSFANTDETYDNALLLTRTEGAVQLMMSGNLLIYTSCRKCRPVLVASSGWGLDRIREEALWVEFNVTFEFGTVKTTEMRTSDRAALFQKLQQQGVPVLEDEHPISVAHFYKLEHSNE